MLSIKNLLFDSAQINFYSKIIRPEIERKLEFAKNWKKIYKLEFRTKA
jgi:hypothetical protein